MNAEYTKNETQAIEVARRDFAESVSPTDGYRVTVATEKNGYVVHFLRQLAAGEPMIRDAGMDAVVTYYVSETFVIEKVERPR